MNAIVIILLSLGFTAGVLFSTIGNEHIVADQTECESENGVVHIESSLDSMEDSNRDSIFPLL